MFRTAVAALTAGVMAAIVSLALPAFTDEKPRRRAIDHRISPPTVTARAIRSGDTITIQASSRRSADRLIFEFDRGVDVLRVNGVKPAPPNHRATPSKTVTVYAREAVVEIRAGQTLGITVSDLTYGLPPDASEKVRARDEAGAVTSHRGDVTISSTTLKISRERARG
jgi:hypothetical protein